MKHIKFLDNKLIYANCDLNKFVKQYSTPLKITFQDIIKNQIIELKKVFDDSIKAKNYKGKFIYLNANKANYSFETINIATMYADGLETSSHYDLLLTAKILKNNKNKKIVCNGVKDKPYLDTILKLNEQGFDITCIIDSKNEFDYLNKKLNEQKLKVGLRIHLTSLYAEDNAKTKDDRFGLIKDDLNYIIDELQKNEKFILTTIHFHQRGFSFEEPKFWDNFMLVFSQYYVQIKKQFNSLCNLNIGGGTPILLTEDFEYSKWINLMLDKVSAVCKKENINEPNIVTENGKYTVKDSTVTIYKIVATKTTDGVTPWYIIDGSFFSAIAEHYEAGEEFNIQPINLLNNKMIDVRLAGLTCDCDDIYYEENGTIKMPEIKTGETLYIAILGCGSYQDSMQGRGGVHHCLMPEEMRLIRDLNGRYKILNKKQNILDIWRILSN